MNIIITIVAIIAAIFLLGAIWGRIEKRNNRQRAHAVVLPDAPLNDIKICVAV